MTKVEYVWVISERRGQVIYMVIYVGGLVGCYTSISSFSCARSLLTGCLQYEICLDCSYDCLLGIGYLVSCMWTQLKYLHMLVLEESRSAAQTNSVPVLLKNPSISLPCQRKLQKETHLDFFSSKSMTIGASWNMN